MIKQYLCIDLKSFYASAECVERGLDPLTANLVVADASRTDKTICLAVSPSLKALGVSGRPRLFEVVQKVAQVNVRRKRGSPFGEFTGASVHAEALKRDPSLAVDYVIAPPRMAVYMQYSTRIYDIYLQHVAPEDIYAYSVDEVFMDITPYLKAANCSSHEFAVRIIRDVLRQTGITATAGIGTNMYLAKIAMDITAKRMPADKDGVRIAELDEMSYREKLWSHRPLTDFWRVGRGISAKLEANGLYTMGDIARCSTSKRGEDLLYKLFGINAELLIDHAWGWEPCTVAQAKAYTPTTNSLSTGQVLQCPYTFSKARLIAREMADNLTFDLVAKRLVTDQITLTVGYDIESLTDPVRRARYHGKITTDPYGRQLPVHAHGTVNFPTQMSSTKQITEAVVLLFERITDPDLLIRRITIAACRLAPEGANTKKEEPPEQLCMFVDYEALERKRRREQLAMEREKNLQHAIFGLKQKYGKNTVLKGMNFEEGATARDRNRQIGGHRA